MIHRLLLILLLANSAIAQFAGDIDEDGVATAIDVVRLSNHLNTIVPLSADRLRLADVDQNGIIDAADLAALAAAVVGQRQLLDTGLAPTARADSSATNQATVIVSGHSTPGASVSVYGAANAASTSADANGAYSVAVTLRPNQLNRLYVNAGETPRALTVLHDDTPPRLFVESPGGSTIYPNEPVLGRALDVSPVTVLVNGVAAEFAHGSFARADVAIPLGSSSITVVATDSAGNQSSEVITIERQVDDGESLQLLSQDPPTVSVPWPNKLVSFSITSGDGSVDDARIQQVFSDPFGVACVGDFQAGKAAGRGNHRLQISSVDVPGVILLHASVDPGAAVHLHADSGDRQIAEAGAPAPRPLRVWANDGRYGIPGISVQFTSSDGHFAGANSATVATDASGHAEVTATLGDSIGNQEFQATFAGNQLPPVRFVIEAIGRSQANTSLRGTIQNTVHQPLPFATCELRIGETTLSVHSSNEGSFEFDDIPGSGYAELSISLFGFSSLSQTVLLVPDADNRMPDAIRLTRTIDQVLFDNSTQTFLRISDFGGLRFTVLPGSLANAPRILSLDAVHADELPVPPPDGARSPIAWYLGPEDAEFDPPIAFELPNVSGLAPNSSVEILRYEPSIGDFVVVATGTVNEDGARIRSDADSGISRGGYGAFFPPFPAHGAASNCSIDCGDPVALVGGALTTESHAFVGEELILDLEIPIDPGQEALQLCGADEQTLLLASQAVTSRVDVYRDGILIDSVSDSYVPDADGIYTLELVAELRGPCPKSLRISQQVEVAPEDCAVSNCITPATLSGSPVPERVAAVAALGDGAVALGFALRSPQLLLGGEAEYNCGTTTFTRTRATRALPYVWEIRRRHDDAVINTGSGTVADATVDSPGCYYATFTGQPGTCVGAGPLVFESPETSVIDATLTLDDDLVCVGDTLTGTLNLSAPPCDGALSLTVSGGAELVSSDDSSFTLRGTAPGIATVLLEIDGAVFAQASVTVFQLAFPDSFAVVVGKEAALPITVEPASAATAFADFAIPLSIITGDGDAQFRSGITLSRELEVTLGGLAQGGVIVRAVSAGICQVATPCADVSIQVVGLSLTGGDLCTGESGSFAFSSNIDTPVTLRIRTAFGAGSSRFASSGTKELQLSSSGSFVVDGLLTSSDPGNQIIEAYLPTSDSPCASLSFTVAEFAFAVDPLKVCVGNEQAVSYSVLPGGFVPDITLRTSDASKAIISGNQVRGVSGSDSVDDTQLILALNGVDCATRNLTVIELLLPDALKLCLGQTSSVAVSAKPDDAACTVDLSLAQGGVTFPDGSRSRSVDLATLNADGLDLLASAPSVGRNDSQLVATGPNGETCASIGLTVLDISFSTPGSICINQPGAVLVQAKPPLPETSVTLVIDGPGLAVFSGGVTSRSFTMAELDGQSIAVTGFTASNACDDMSIEAVTAVGGICASATFTVVDISFDADNDKICVGASRNIGITAQPADANCLVTLELDNARATFAGGASSIQKSLAELNSSGIDVTAVSASAAANDTDLAVDVGGGGACYHNPLTMVELQFVQSDLTFCAGQGATLDVVALPDVADCVLPVQVTGGLIAAGDASRSLASLNTDGLELSGDSGTVSVLVNGQACASFTPTVLDLDFPAAALKVCKDGTLSLAISANPALSDISGTLSISNGLLATFGDGSTSVTDTLENLAAGIDILGVATSSNAGDIALTLTVNGIECASATLTVFEIIFSDQTFDICIGSTFNVGVTAIPSVNDCSVTLTTTGSGDASIDGNASRSYTLAELNLLGVAITGNAAGSRSLIIDAGAGCPSPAFTITDCAP